MAYFFLFSLISTRNNAKRAVSIELVGEAESNTNAAALLSQGEVAAPEEDKEVSVPQTVGQQKKKKKKKRTGTRSKIKMKRIRKR